MFVIPTIEEFRYSKSHKIKKRHSFGILALLIMAEILFAQSDVVNTRHNLSAGGPGTLRALNESRVCVFCHTPHNASPSSPLWNKEIRPEVYTIYTSPSLKASVSQPTGTTKLCLTCHDGTIALSAVMNPPGGIRFSGSDRLPPGSLSDLGLNLSNHHPVSFSYRSSLPNDQLSSIPPPYFTYDGEDEVQCSTCHDPHSDRLEKFLVMDHRNSALCTACHQMTGWSTSAHATSDASVVGILPRPPKTWPQWTRLNEWGCQTCHTPHFASTGEKLLNFSESPPEPFSCIAAGCHSARPAPGHDPSPSITMADIAGQMEKISAHRIRNPMQSIVCSDCHHPHQMNSRPATAPFVSGFLQGVPGIDRNGIQVSPATYEYEICFKCHSKNTADFDYVPRIINITDTRLAFHPDNPSYHPVVSIGKNFNVPSLPSSFRPSVTASSMIYCSDCHADDGNVSNGPHGSSFPPILKLRYETADNTPENYDNYALCYQCHDRNSILSDNSFRKKIGGLTSSGGGHSGHLLAGAPCSACHDPHGVNLTSTADTGSHTHLINFDTRMVLPAPGNTLPVFRDEGTFAGSCSLQCHGKVHQNLSYP